MGPCYKFDRPEAIRDQAKTDEFLRSLCPGTLPKLFGALDAVKKTGWLLDFCDFGMFFAMSDNFSRN